MATERPNGTTMKGNPLTLIGPALKAGDKAPNFSVRTQDLKPYSLADSTGKVRLFSVVPSLDTPVCDAQTRRFNQEAAQLGDKVEIITVSVDLPFAQKRWCGAAGIDKIKVVSDYYDRSFSEAYGTLIKELHIDSRAIFIVDGSDTIRYVEYVPEVADHPNYDKALAAAKGLI
ncbi:MAG: thiol peroxidase [Acidobacteriia bacterium]|nr:thiol peroxidase [Terriglobia bacterium]